MSISRFILFIALAVYLIFASVVMSAIGNFYHADLGVTEEEYSIASEDLGGFITGLSILPVYVNLFFILIPFILEIVLGVSLFFPGGDAGG